MRCLDERTVADVHPFVLWHTGRVRSEEHEISRLKLITRDAEACVILEPRVMAQLDPELSVHVHRESGAVEAGGRIAAPDVRHAEEAIRERDRLAPERGVRGEDLRLEKRRYA